MEPSPTIFKSDLSFVNCFVGGEVFPVQLRTLLNFETSGTYFRERVVKNSEMAYKVTCVAWDAAPNPFKHRIDIDRDGKLFRWVLQFMRNGPRTALPEDKQLLLELLCEAEFYGMERFKHLIKKRLWKQTGKATYYACYSDSD